MEHSIHAEDRLANSAERTGEFVHIAITRHITCPKCTSATRT